MSPLLIFCRGINHTNMESSPGLVRRRIQEMTTTFQAQNSPRNSPKNSPKLQTRKKIQPPLQPSLAKGDSNKTSSTSSLSNKHFNSMGAKPYKPMYTATATATITTSKSPASCRRVYNSQKTLNDKIDGRKSNGNEKQKANFEVKNKRVLPPSVEKIETNGENEKIRMNSEENNERLLL